MCQDIDTAEAVDVEAVVIFIFLLITFFLFRLCCIHISIIRDLSILHVKELKAVVVVEIFAKVHLSGEVRNRLPAPTTPFLLPPNQARTFHGLLIIELLLSAGGFAHTRVHGNI